MLRGLIQRGIRDELRAQVGSEDQDGVAEVDRPALPVGEPAVIEHLQQDVEDLLVRLFHLVEQDHAIRPPPYRLGELAAFLVPDVAGRGADQPGHRVPLRVLAHVDADHRPLVVEQELCQRLGQLGLADAGGPEEQERARRAVGVRDARARPPDGVRYGLDGPGLTDQPLAELGLHAEQLAGLALEEAPRGYARPRGHDVGNVVRADLLLDHRPGVRNPGCSASRCVSGIGRDRRRDLPLQHGNLPVHQARGGLEVRVPLGALGLPPEVVQALLQLADLVQARLLLVPAGDERRQLLLPVGQVRAEPLQPLPARWVGLLGQRHLLHQHPVH